MTSVWILTAIVIVAVFLFGLFLPNPPKDKDHKPGC